MGYDLLVFVQSGCCNVCVHRLCDWFAAFQRKQLKGFLQIVVGSLVLMLVY